MRHSLRKIRESINVNTLEEFAQLLTKMETTYFENTFHKTQAKYLGDIQLLFQQLEDDFHYVHILKQKTHTFQLQWKESVLKAHLDLLIPNLPYSYLKQPTVSHLKVV
jgi:hypothetical protein